MPTLMRFIYFLQATLCWLREEGLTGGGKLKEGGGEKLNYGGMGPFDM